MAHLQRTWRVSAPLAQRIVRTAYQEARAVDVEPTLLLAVIAKESSFRPDALSSAGAVGLMQVLPRFHSTKLRAGESLAHPETNIRVGAQVLHEYLTQARGALDSALRRYSGGATRYAHIVRARQRQLEMHRRGPPSI